jgi:hemoglobin/transferrin/lactoferrin receptor protein
VRGSVCVLLCSLVLGFAIDVRAQAPNEGYGASATLTRAAFEEARSVAVVKRAQIEATNAGDVGDMLERAPFVVVQRTASGSATPILRGLTGYQVLLLQDDLRLNDALTRAGGSATLNLVDPESVAQIEIVRGPASVLYGSDALGGVVHVRTRDTLANLAGENDVTASALVRGAGAEHAARAQGGLAAGLGRVGLWLSGARGYAGQVLRGGGLGEQPFTGHQDWSAANKLEVVPARGQRISLAYQSGHLFDMPRSDVSTREDVQRTLSLDRDAVVLTYRGRALAGRLRLHSYMGVSQRGEHRQRLRPGNDQHERERVRTLQAGLRVSGNPWFGASMELGFETNVERIESDAWKLSDGMRTPAERGRYVDGSRYALHALYALLTQRVLPRLTLLLGARGTLALARASRDPLFEVDLGPGAALDRRFARPVASLGVRGELLPSLTLVASVLGGFRAPNLEDFQAFGGAARGYTVPNLKLNEERSWSFEGGLEYLTREWDVRGYGFATLLSGLIVRVVTSLEGMTEVDGQRVIGRRNASRGLLAGGELSATRRASFGLFGSVAGSLTWGKSQRPDDEGQTVHEPASKVPPPTAVLRTGYEHPAQPYFGSLTLALQAPQSRLSEGDRLDVRLCPAGPEVCREVPGFVELTLRAGLRLREGVLVTIAAENLLDAGYRTYASGAYAPGRNFMAGLRVTL